MSKKIPPFRLIPQPINDEASKCATFQKTGSDIGMRHQIGGEPKFLQDSIYPNCPKCKKQMTFYGQFDSINDDICLADCGMIYVFVCFDCYETNSFIQSN